MPLRVALASSLSGRRAPHEGLASIARTALASWNASNTASVAQLCLLESGVSPPVESCDRFLAQYYQSCAAYLQTVSVTQQAPVQEASGGTMELRPEAALCSRSQVHDVLTCAIMAFPYAFTKCDPGSSSASLLSTTSPVSCSLGLACLQIADGVNSDDELASIRKWLCTHSLKEAVASLLATCKSRVITSFLLHQIPQRVPIDTAAATPASVSLESIVHGSPILACIVLDDNITRFSSPLQFAFSKAGMRTESTVFF